MMTTNLVRRIGLDRNPLRRRIDNVATALTVVLLADWEAAWTAVGPQWTRRFRSRGNP